MQLRKCLCHPFVYSQEIEERTDIAAVSHRNLVDASSKLKLLELLLPKLQEQGHRVLIFSQFLDMLVSFHMRYIHLRRHNRLILDNRVSLKISLMVSECSISDWTGA